MLRHSLTLVLLAPLLFAAGDQEDLLPPGILLLSRIKNHVAGQMERLPEYTCLETVQRFTKSGAPKSQMEPMDTVRLEVLFTGRQELYSPPGGRVFHDDPPSSYTAGGMIGDGVFAAHVRNIFQGGATIFTWRGEDQVGVGRGWARAVRYDFRISRMQSGYSVTVPGGSGIVGMKGRFWADPETYELLRLEIHGDDIPPDLPISDVSMLSSYAPMRIGSQDIMLPQSAELRMLQLDGRESLDVFDFTHCRSYSAESSIRFGAAEPETVEKSGPAPERSAGVLPAGLSVPVTLTTPIEDDSAVGALLEGRVSAKVELKGKTILPEGALVRGRLRRLERYTDLGTYWMVGLEFTGIETESIAYRFFADLQTASGVANLEWTLVSGRHSGGNMLIEEHIRPGDLPGVGSFILKGSKVSLPAGFRMIWKTRSLAADEEKPPRRK